MTNKNPYEVRLDVLQMAKDMLMAEQNQATQLYASDLSALTQSGANAALISEFTTSARATLPKPFTDADVIAKASSLYSFVNNNKA